MLFLRFYDERLAQAAYLVGCQATGDAIVVDPPRHVEPILLAARREGVRITHVTETHIHADFVSGARELASRTGARLLLSGEGGPDWSYGYAAGDEAQLLHDGDHVMVGNVRLDVLHTPGHTPEHLAFVVTDTPAAAGPMGILSGDFVFVGDVGRPDLLERAAGHAGTMEAGARTLFRSLQRVKRLPDHLQLWPGHGAGSACGKALGAVPASTLGYERIANWGLLATDEDAFVRDVLAGQPSPPTYFARMKRVNRDGPTVLGARPRPSRLGADALRATDGRRVVDLRSSAAFAAGHLAGSYSIPLNRSFPTWAGWLLEETEELVLVVDGESEGTADDAVRALASVGLDRVAGWAPSSALEEWRAAGGTLDTIPQTDADALAPRLGTGEATVLDVRARSEWEAGHLPGVPNVPVGELPRRIAELPAGRPVVLQCQGGSRSMIAASVLRAHGVRDVVNLAGGFAEWRARGHAVEWSEGSPPSS